MSLEQYMQVSVPAEYAGEEFVLVYHSREFCETDVLHYPATFFDERGLREYSDRLARTNRVPVAYFLGADARLADELLHYADLLDSYESVCDVVARLSAR